MTLAPPPPPPPLRVRVLKDALLGVTAVAALFCLAVAFLLAADAAAVRSADPVDSEALSALRERLRQDPGDGALAAQLRALDAVNRRAYLGSVSFRREGAFLLLGGAVVLLLGLRSLSALSPQTRIPGPVRDDPAPPTRALLAGVGAAVVLASLFLLAFLRSPLAPGAAATSRWEERVAEWPALRGPDGSARARGSFPREWDGPSGRGVRWKVPVPRPGQSSPVVWKGRVFLTGADSGARELFCFDAEDGSLVWRAAVGGFPGSPAALPPVSPDTGLAASTPATDGKRVFALFATGDLAAYDFEGRFLWGRNLGVPRIPYGHASSLLVFQDLLIAQLDGQDRARVLALRAATGETAWESPRPVRPSWASPVLLTGEGRRELVLNGNPFVMGYDPRTGEEFWRIEGMGGELATSPAFGPGARAGTVVVANEFARGMAIRLDGAPTVAWQTDAPLPDVASPLVTEELAVLATGRGTVTALALADGAPRWREEFPRGFYSSPVLAGGLLYLLDRDGVTRVLAPAGEPRRLASNPLGEPATATPAFVRGRVYLRGERHLFCVQEGTR